MRREHRRLRKSPATDCDMNRQLVRHHLDILTINDHFTMRKTRLNDRQAIVVRSDGPSAMRPVITVSFNCLQTTTVKKTFILFCKFCYYFLISSLFKIFLIRVFQIK